MVTCSFVELHIVVEKCSNGNQNVNPVTCLSTTIVVTGILKSPHIYAKETNAVTDT